MQAKDAKSPTPKKSFFDRWSGGQRSWDTNLNLFLMALPGILLLFLFAYLPMFGIIIAFKNYRFADGIFGSAWVGFENFRFLFGTDTAFRITRNTLGMNSIQGKHWEWADEANKVIKFPDGIDGATSTYNPNADWEFGNQFNGYYRDAKQVGAWEKTKEMNDTAFPSEALGFVVDRTPIQTEIAQTTAVWKELVEPIANGWVSWDAAADAREKLYAAGAQTIIDEVQRQLNDWAATNKTK